MEKFATYFRDSDTGLDYADQRYHAPGQGGFWRLTRIRRVGVHRIRDRGIGVGTPINQFDPKGTIAEAPPQDPANTFWWCNGGPCWLVVSADKILPTDPPPSQEEWDNLSVDCQNALKSAVKGSVAGMVATLNRAVASWDVLTAAGNAHGIDPSFLAAIGIEESGFRDIAQSGGLGRGVFQIDLGQNPSVTESQANDIAFAADWAAKYLSNKRKRPPKGVPESNRRCSNAGVGRIPQCRTGWCRESHSEWKWSGFGLY